MNTIDFDSAMSALADLPVANALGAIEKKLALLRNYENTRMRDVNALREKRVETLKGGCTCATPCLEMDDMMRYRLVEACAHQFMDDTKATVGEILVLLAMVLRRCGLSMSSAVAEATVIAQIEAAKAERAEREEARREAGESLKEEGARRDAVRAINDAKRRGDRRRGGSAK